MKKLLLTTMLSTVIILTATHESKATGESFVKATFGGKVTVQEFASLGQNSNTVREFIATKDDTTKVGGSIDVDTFKAGKALGLSKDDLVQVGRSDAMKAKIKAKGIAKADVQTAAAAAKAAPDAAAAKAAMDAAAGGAAAGGAGGIPTPPPMPGTVEKEVFDLLGKKHGTPEQIAAFKDLKTFGLPAGHPDLDDLNGYMDLKALLKANPTYPQLDAYMNLSKNILKTKPSADEFGVFAWLSDAANAAEPAVVHFNALADKDVFIVAAAKMAGASAGDKAKAQFTKATAGAAGGGGADPVGAALKGMGEADTPANRKLYTDLDAMLKGAGDARRIQLFDFAYYGSMVKFGNAAPTHPDFLAYEKYFKIRKNNIPTKEGYDAMRYAESNAREATYTRIMNTPPLRALFDANTDVAKLKDALDVNPGSARFDAEVSIAIDPAAGKAAAIDQYKLNAQYVYRVANTADNRDIIDELQKTNTTAKQLELVFVANIKGKEPAPITYKIHPDLLGKPDNINFGIPKKDITFGTKVYLGKGIFRPGKFIVQSVIYRND